jgi:phosphoglycolate phosphatase
MNPPFANFIFDFDGTLTDSREDIAAAQIWALRQIGAEGIGKEQIFPHIGKTLQETFALLLPPSLHGKIPEAVRLYSEYYPPRSLLTTTLFPGVRETLEELVRRGKKLAVASTKRGPGILRVADHFGITQLFAQLQGSDGMPYKPDPSIILKILEDQAWDRRQTVMVGDTGHDIEAGRRGGVATCGVTYGSLAEKEIRSFHPDYVIRSFPELLHLVSPVPEEPS